MFALDFDREQERIKRMEIYLSGGSKSSLDIHTIIYHMCITIFQFDPYSWFIKRLKKNVSAWQILI
jgi:hypothetical protein